VLRRDGRLGPFVFHTRSGALTATVNDGQIDLDFPAKPVHPVDAPDGLIDALGVTPVATYANGMDILAEVEDAAAVAAVRPDIEALRSVECRGVIVTAAAAGDADHDFVSRFFAPRVGVDEDPVTGSAHCALAPFWAERFNRPSLTGVQLSPRGGRVGVAVHGDRVVLSGSAVTVLAGELAG
jgi:PhzF family phenazine biosynthesis protein